MLNEKPFFHFFATQTIKDISEKDWVRLFGKDVLEGWGYHKNFEEAKIKEFHLGFLCGRRNEELVAVFPFFTTVFSFATIIQGPVQKIILKLERIFPHQMKPKLLFVGLPTAEELYLGYSKEEDLGIILDGVLKKFYDLMKKERIGTILFYNLSQRHKALAESLKRKGFACMENFPNTKIEIRESSLEEYIKKLSRNTRKDLRRRLKKSLNLATLKTEVITDITGIEGDIYKLYLNNFNDSDLHFETLTPEFFRNICHNMPGVARFFITRDRDKIVAFNFCLAKNDTCIDKFIGFDNELSHKYHLYHVTFCHNIDWCIKNGFRFYQMGITDYHPKLRLGAKLIPLYIYLRRINPFTNILVKLIAGLIQPKNFDPTLRRLTEE
ncbi:MAG: GNAT family N-acetyltransferase [Candidatus Omnitrophica bacterium]|nr:GNAT family N-acetyltransferase [Candidatus Omnitrophota bacterium]